MATYTREEFVKDVLLELGVLDANEAPEAEDSADISRLTQQKFEDLYEDGLIPFDVDGDIPARYYRALVSQVANDAKTQYGASARAAELEAKADIGMRRLWKFRQRAYFGTPTQATYY